MPAADSSPPNVVRHAIGQELAEEEWASVLRRRAEPLVGHLDAHLFHGLIRTAHATRALQHHDHPDAHMELAAGLAAWTVWAGDEHEVTPSTATDTLAEILEMAQRGAGAFATTPSIFTLHEVTAPMAYLLLADHLDATTHAVAAAVFARTHRRHPVTRSRS